VEKEKESEDKENEEKEDSEEKDEKEESGEKSEKEEDSETQAPDEVTTTFPPLADGAGFIGCFQDAFDRDMPKLGGITHLWHECQMICKGFGFEYFAIQAGDQCYCGETYGRYEELCDCQCEVHGWEGYPWKSCVFGVPPDGFDKHKSTCLQDTDKTTAM